jgi:hypothetical protein
VAEFLKDQRYDSDLVQELDDGLERLGSVDQSTEVDAPSSSRAGPEVPLTVRTGATRP